MQQKRFKPQVTNLEDRTTPSITPTDVFNAIADANTARDTLRAIQAMKPDMVNVYTVAFLKNYLPTLTVQSQAADAVLSEYQNTLAGEAASNPQLAPYINTIAQSRYEAEVNAVYAVFYTNVYGGIPISNVITPIPANSPIPPTPVAPPVTPPVTPPVSPPPVLDKTTSAGMSETIPDITTADFVTQASGLQVADVVVGDGTAVQDGDTVKVFYSGWLKDTGVEFDSNRTSSSPASFSTNGVIEGFKEGLIGMKPGGIRRVVIPSELGYGATGSPPSIPANADLVFEIKVVE